MADDPTKRGAADRSKVAALQKHEVDYLRKKLGVTEAQVKAAVAKVGHSRDKVEAELKKK
jgi:hypothetical protein